MTDLTGKEDDDILVCVKAQVMTRDDNSGGWVPLGEGGYSKVALKRFYHPGSEETPRFPYVIIGQRLADNAVILQCFLKEHIHYTCVNPTFHHWNIDEERYGLTFERASDAGSFYDSVKNAVAHLKDGRCRYLKKDVENDNIFMAIDLPLGRKDSSSQSASTTSTTTSSPTLQSPLHIFPSMHEMASPANNQHHLHPVLFSSTRHHQPHQPHQQHQQQQPQQQRCASSPVSEKSIIKIDNGDTTSSSGRDEILHPEEQAMLASTGKPPSKDYPYVVFTKDSEAISAHVYSYPQMEPIPRGATSNKKTNPVIQQQPPLPTKLRKVDSRKQEKHMARVRCRYCNEYFVREDNHRGSCEYAPNWATQCIEYVSCMCVAQKVIYRCASDSEGEYPPLCMCDNDELNCRRWTVLTFLSFVVPCLCCYKPLTKCHDCSIQCGVCGGRHEET